jgi:PAS domain S-box-containing protein
MNSPFLPQEVIDLIPAAICVCSARSRRIIQYNRAAAELAGLESTEALAGPFRLLKADGSGLLCGDGPAAQVAETGTAVRAYDGLIERQNGTRVSVSINIEPVCDRSGDVIGTVQVLRPVPAPVAAEPESPTPLEQSPQFFNSELFGIVYWKLIDNDIVATDGNPVFCEVSGYSREELQSGTIRRSDVAVPGYEKAMRDSFAQLSSTGSLSPYEVEFKAKDGRIVPLLVHGTVLDKQKRTGMSLAVDLSELHAARKRAREFESQLLHSQKMEAVGQLAGGVAHDFNNLMMAISSQAELLLEAKEQTARERRVRQILSATQSAAQLTRKLLAFSRKQELATSVFDFNRLVAETSDLIRHVVPKNVDIDLRLTDSSCYVKSDRGQMEQTIINLILNARDAMPEGGKLVLSTVIMVVDENDLGQNHGVPNGEYVLITVADTGCGIPKENIARIFEPFFTTKPKEHGTGLGLSIAYGIVNQSGGHIRVRSTLDAGTTFSIYMPLAPPPEVNRMNHTYCPNGYKDIHCPRKGTALVVDDEEFVRTAVCAFLEDQGLTVINTGDPKEALTIAAELKNDLVLLITDVVMPNMNGTELADKLLAQIPELPVIFMSGYAAGELGHKRFSGAKFLQKPFTRANLLNAVCAGLRACKLVSISPTPEL